jgi:GNAT superfamily N-acetyltransferase
MRAVERAAGAQFADVGMPEIAAHEPMGAASMGQYVDGGRAWVAVDGAGAVVGYVLADVVDGAGHVEQLSVDPGWQRRGLGRGLVDAVAGWACAHGMAGLTLTTFKDVPWNGPAYERMGFVVIPEDEWSPGLRALVAEEEGYGLDRDLRVVMGRAVAAVARPGIVASSNKLESTCLPSPPTP